MRRAAASGAAGEAPAGAVAAGHEVTAAAAAEILEDGGTVFDAAIAGLWAACVAEPVLASPAGGGFLMAREAGGETLLFDFFVAAPGGKRAGAEVRAITVDFGTARQEFHIGAGTAGVPGFVPGLFAVHDRLGRLPMARLLAPAIAAARGGVELTPFQAHVAELVKPILVAEPASARHFAPSGALPAAGTVLRQDDLAGTLETVAREGDAAFTTGAIAGAMAASTEAGGHLTRADIAGYEVAVRAPLRLAHRGWEIALNPPPAAGGALVGLALRLLEEERPNGPLVPAALARALAGVGEVRARWGEAAAARIAEDHLAGALGAIAGRPRARRGTTHISVVDGAGNAAAATVSNGEGNGRLVGGFLMNNVLGEDDVNPGGIGNWTPGARLASMMAPTVMSRAGRAVAFGSGGSNRIRSAMALVAGRVAAGESLADAVAAPRLHVEGRHLDFEAGFSAAEREELAAAFPDHRAWPEPHMFFGGVHAAARGDGGEVEAAADRRRAGAIRVTGG